MRILVIDDEANICEYLKKRLGEAFFSVETCPDGERGSYLARTGNFDLIVLDNVLPKKTGVEVCRDIRGAGISTPVLVISSKTDADSKVELLNAGADDYLSKPFDFEELLARVRALNRRPQEIRSEVLIAGNIALNAKDFTVTVGGRPVTLTRKEFMILEYLMRNRGTALTRSMILEKVWGCSQDLFSNTIETHITSLRRKLGIPADRMVRTISGVGYIIDSHKS